MSEKYANIIIIKNIYIMYTWDNFIYLFPFFLRDKKKCHKTNL